jgi:hypothetical protein
MIEGLVRAAGAGDDAALEELTEIAAAAPMRLAGHLRACEITAACCGE